MTRSHESPSRREFIAASTGSALGAWIAVHFTGIQVAAAEAARARAEQQPFQLLTAEEARDLEAVAAQIIPADDMPGAREAGVIYFVDRALGSFASWQLEAVRGGLADLTATVRSRHGAGATFAALAGADQTALLREVEQSPFFAAMKFLTVAGMFADPSYGGNRDQVGWQLLGFEMRGGYQPPFGYYDREYRETGR